MPARKHESFIDGFRSLVLPKGAPSEFATWTALWMLGAAVERKAYTFTRGEQLFPNLFVFLIGPPGWGKGLTLEPAHRIVSRLGKNRVGASSMTHASLADDLRAGHRTYIDKETKKPMDFWSLNILSPELQVLLPENNIALLGKVTYLYDGKEYSETRRGNKEENSFNLPRCLVSVVGGTTPTHLFSTFPESAFSTGLFSRIVMIWGDPGQDSGDLFSSGMDEDAVTKLENSLTDDLRVISEYQGRFLWDQGAKDKANIFYKQHRPYGGDPVPSHPRLLHYSTRRTQHLIKIMMLRAVDLGTFTLTGPIYDWSYEVLISAESRMPEIFQEQNQGGESNIVNDVHHELTVMYIKRGKPIPRAIVYQLFGARVQAFKIEPLINMSVTGGWLEQVNDKALGRCYIPKGTRPTDTEVIMRKEK
jgi:hypothetical protein